MMTKLAHVLTCLCSLLFGAPAQAAVVAHDLVLQVERVGSASGIGGAPCFTPTPPRRSFGCDIRPGDIFIGHFSVDDSLLAREGDNLNGPIFHFFLQIGTVVWDQDHPSDLAGFRQFVEGDSTGLVRLASAPSFNIHGGRITALTGGVFGGGDAPFVDFFNVPALNTFGANDDSITRLEGTLIVGRSASAVAEPGTLALLAFVLVCATRCRSRQRAFC
jgi:hypothetical protein